MIANDCRVGAIVDATNLIHRIYNAGGERHCLGNFVRQLDQIENHINPNPSWLICAFDSPELNRKKVDPQYKANRPEKPEELKQVLHDAKEAAANAGWLTSIEIGYEADDVLASCAAYLSRIGHRALLVSSDKDLNQCLRRGKVSIAKKVSVNGVSDFVTADEFEKVNGLTPAQWIDYQTLVGDSTDNVFGAVGVGPKNAKKLLQSAGSLAAILEQPEIASTKRLVDNLVAFKTRAATVRELVELKADLPVGHLFK